MEINKRLLKADCILKLPYPVLIDHEDKTKTHFFCRATKPTDYYFRGHYYYSVRYLGNEHKYQKWDCECVDFQRNIEYQLDFMCKHCYAVSLAVQLKRRLRHIDPRTLLPTTTV